MGQQKNGEMKRRFKKISREVWARYGGSENHDPDDDLKLATVQDKLCSGREERIEVSILLYV